MVFRSLLGVVLLVLAGGCTATVDERVTLAVHAAGPAIDQPVRVSVEGLDAEEPVRVWARLTDRSGQRWQSAADVVADPAGRVDVATAASTGGTYRGVDPDGLFWSMRLPDEQAAPFPLVDGDRVAVEVGVDRDGRTAASTTVERLLRAPGARVVRVAESGMVGDLHLPAGTGPWPGVLLLGGSEGGRPDPGYASLLAGRGFVVFGLAYFGVEGRPPVLSRIPVEYGLAGARWLAGRAEVRGPRVGIVGTSKGAEYALLLASAEPSRFAAVAANVPSDVVWPSLAFDPGSGPVSSWTRDGADVPFLSWPATGGGGAPPPAGQPVRVGAAYATAMAAAPPEQRAAARIPVERIDAPVLLTSGGDDGIWPSGPQADRVLEALGAAGNRHLHFPAAGHFLAGVPNVPTTRTAYAAGPVLIESGGDPAATARARRETFAATVELLGRALAG
ncbi:acyl-CoA thioesterase/BAAT N-terminal domain-containing protein [Actinomycetes bacterium KLBMP 9759]